MSLLNQGSLLFFLKVLTHLVGQSGLLQAATELDTKLEALSEVQHFNIGKYFVMLISHNRKSDGVKNQLVKFFFLFLDL